MKSLSVNLVLHVVLLAYLALLLLLPTNAQSASYGAEVGTPCLVVVAGTESTPDAVVKKIKISR